MSAAGSPVAAGSPTAAEGAELVSRMVQAAEAAASAAAAATQALASLSSGDATASSSTTDWFKVLPKPSQFSIRKIEKRSCPSSETGGGRWNSML